MTAPGFPALPPPNILSIQSWVSFGHVGNAAAVFPLQRLGFEVWAINTVQFSNHTGYGAWTGQVAPPETISELMSGIEARGALPTCAALLSGYLGSGGTASAVAAAVRQVRAASPGALYACDPVMGDVGRGVFVRPELPTLISELAVPHADLLTPNQFELELLSGQQVRTLEDALAAAHALRARMRPGGPRTVLVTSLMRQDAPPWTAADGPADGEAAETLAVSGEGAWLCRTPLLPLDPPRNGTGDVIAALFLGQYLKTGSVPQAQSLAMSALFALLARTHAAGTREIQLVAAQDDLVTPPTLFPAERVGQAGQA